VLVSVGGDIVVERYWNSSATTTNDTFSVTKSVTGALAGIAVADGSLRGPDQPLRELLPTYAPDMAPTVASITLGQLLTMTAGLPADGPNGPPDWLYSDDWVAGIVSHGTDHAPGEGFAYSSVTSHLIAAAVDDATPGSLLDYAREKLFEPLGIDTDPALEPPMTDDPAVLDAYDRAAFAWPVDPQEHHVGYAYIKLTPRDMVRIGQLYLDGGRWEGAQVVPEDWVRDSTRRHVTTRRGDLDGYGYQWWTTTVRGHPAFVALGYGGQLIEVVPDLRLVVAASTAVKDGETPFDGTTLVTLVRDVVVPHVG
jgi:CubicO group peptidase (beta-lactamase class C family)